MNRIGGQSGTGRVRDRTVLAAATASLMAAAHAPASAQVVAPTPRAGIVSSAMVIDGQSSETAWESADAIEEFHRRIRSRARRRRIDFASRSSRTRSRS